MSQAPRRINTQRSLNRPTEQRPTEAPASRPAPLQGQPDFFEEPSVPHPEQRPRPAAPAHPAPAAGTGLRIIYQSIQLLNTHNKEKITFQILPGQEEGTAISIFIPYQYSYEWQ